MVVKVQGEQRRDTRATHLALQRGMLSAWHD